MVITSRNDSPVFRRYFNSQLNYALVYVIVTLAVLLVLNIYCSKASQKLFYQSNERSMIEKCQLAADEISALDVINSSTVADTVEQLGSLKVTRLMVTNQNGLVIYDSYGTDLKKYALLPEIITALKCNDVFYWQYHDGAMQSHAATPLITNSTVSGCVYMMQHDTSQGALIKSLQSTILRITMILEIALIFFSLTFSKTFSRRLRQIMASMRIIQQGDYTHKLKLGGHDELTFLGDEFNSLTEKLQTSEQKRARFVSDASHELKTPLASIRLLTDSILQDENIDRETTREFVGDIGEAADRLIHICQELLELNRLDEGRTGRQEAVDVNDQVEKTCRLLLPLAEESQVTLETRLGEACVVRCSSDGVNQILRNLMENAIKYNMPGGQVTVTTRREGEQVCLVVSDTGVGIPEADRNRIFERFYRVDKARSRDAGGTGLGLSIVRDTVRLYGGTIAVAPNEPGGTTFTVLLPAWTEEEGTA